MNGCRPLPAEGRSDIQLLVNADDDDDWLGLPSECAVQQPHDKLDTTNVNIRAAMVHVIGDLIQSIGVFTAAVIVLIKVSVYFNVTATNTALNNFCCL